MTSSASPSADVVIVGGAVMGSSAAYHLLADSGFKGRVIVIEKDPTYQLSASALSAASIRQQYSSAVNIRISLYGIDFLRSIGDRLGVDGERPEIGLREGGYLYCASEAGASILAENHALQAAEGADILCMDPAALKDRFPWLNVDDLAAGTWGHSGEGWFDGWGLLQAFRKKARSLGAEYVKGEVAEIERDGSTIVAVRLKDGTRIACGTLINCAGSGGRAIAAMAGLEIPVQAKRRYVFTFSCKGPVENCPLLIDTSGAYVRPEGEGHFICGASPEADLDPDWFDEDPASQEIDHSFFEEFIWPSLAHRVPAFEAIKPGRAWSGPYDMSLLDHNAIIGQAGAFNNFYLCNGFSGHGLQQAPAVGRGLAELIVHGGYRTLDLSELGYERVLANRPLLERNVI
ncbi:NAD(P)/FAD-dependent oxidoreductase [Microvirga tunisiensis]|uniref:FAD-binding oxidoreductase n=1 Tax=Microvirga tunisiensis TaxID=2108360 RepID=A0A5N7MCZ4_9HYPH|nr:FAD-binding oxidoreductase [Microvirga tunisiensis]MPR06601.1 FAD-binding oxidoreductase [Microvirga tunisiensis]MPR24715.1 FAD-binding oxidoreductase [Microvirga tunisiensis]